MRESDEQVLANEEFIAAFGQPPSQRKLAVPSEKHLRLMVGSLEGIRAETKQIG